MDPKPRPVDHPPDAIDHAVTTIGDVMKRQTQPSGNGTAAAAKRPTEDPRKAALRDLYTANQRLIDAEDALQDAKAQVAEKSKAYDAIRGKRS